jgi:hypothetical protein
MVVVGGGVAQMGDLLLEPIRHVVRDRCLRPAAQSVRITASVLGRRSSSMGAVVQAIETALCALTEGHVERLPDMLLKGGQIEEKPFKNQVNDSIQGNSDAAAQEAPELRTVTAGV